MIKFVWLTLLFICVKAVRHEPTLRTRFGPIRGKWMTSIRGESIAAYLGIPYAQPPIGKLRFKSPQPWKQHWMNVHNTVEDGPKCPQLDENMKVVGDEDCLNLNIFVPQIFDKRKLPVLVFIHGGSFISGSNNSTLLAPDYLLDQGIILVTVNYRLGILDTSQRYYQLMPTYHGVLIFCIGFLSSGNEASPGNYGLKDVIEALSWIQANIEDFGGNTTSVTLAGQSAGAAIVHHLALTNRTENLFDKIITHSGAANTPWAIHTTKYAKIRYITIAIELGCTTNRKIMEVDDMINESPPDYESIIEDDMQIIDCLRTKSTEDLTKMLTYFHLWQNGNPYMNFGPTIEPPSDNAVVLRHPMITIESGEFRDIPWLTGVVADEGFVKSLSFITDPQSLDEFLEKFPDVIPIFLEQEEIIGNHKEYANKLADFYMPDLEYPLKDRKKLMNNITEMLTDGLITYWVYEALNTQSSMMNSSVFFFLFHYDGTFSGTFASKITEHLGITHGDEMNYIFPIHNRIFDDLQLHNTLNDVTMINIMNEMWGNFAKNGIPNAQLSPHWQPYQEDFRFMKLGMGRSPDISMENDFLPMRMEFWNNLMSSVGTSRDILFPEIIDEKENPEEAPNHLTINVTSLGGSAELILPDTQIVFQIFIFTIGYYYYFKYFSI